MDLHPADFRLENTMPVQAYNGRVNLDATPSAGGFFADPNKAGFGYRTEVESANTGTILRGQWDETPLSRKFFSPENIQTIQVELVQQVYARSGDKKWVIDKQDVNELQIVMRAMYLQYAKNLETDIPGQIYALNKLVIDYCVPKIMTEVEAHFYYLKDISKMPVPMDRSVSLSSAGTKSLPFRKFM